MLWFRTTVNRFVRDWCHRDRLLDKAVEEFATTSGRPPVEPESEFVQVIVEMFVTHRSLGSAEEPALQQRRHTMNSWHQLRGRFLLPSEKGHPVSISPGFHWIVSKPAIRVNGTTRLDDIRMRPIPAPSSSAAMTTKALVSVCCPRAPSSGPPI